jgi:hypothetical protein
MTSVRSCGCTYRDTGTPRPDWPLGQPLVTATRLLLTPGPMTWGLLCNKLRCNTYERRDDLHRVLHKIAEPSITPTEGRGRRGTLWTLK